MAAKLLVQVRNFLRVEGVHRFLIQLVTAAWLPSDIKHSYWPVSDKGLKIGSDSDS